MSTDLEKTLRSADGPTMTHPVDDLLSRGDRFRRRRQARAVVAGTAGLAALAAAAYVLMPAPAPETLPIATAPPASGRIDPGATVGWSGEPTNLSAAELDQLSRSCLTSAYATEPLDPGSTATGEIPVGTLPLVAERRDYGIEALFAGGGHLVTCSTPGGIPPGHHFAAAEATGIVFAMSEQAADKWLETSNWSADTGALVALQVPDEVASADLEHAGQTYPTVIVDDVAVAWLSPEEASSQTWDHEGDRPYTWHAYDHDDDPVPVPLSED